MASTPAILPETTRGFLFFFPNLLQSIAVLRLPDSLDMSFFGATPRNNHFPASRKTIQKTIKDPSQFIFLVEYKCFPDLWRACTGTAWNNPQTRKEACHGTLGQPHCPCTGSGRLFCRNGVSELPVRQDRRPPVRACVAGGGPVAFEP